MTDLISALELAKYTQDGHIQKEVFSLDVLWRNYQTSVISDQLYLNENSLVIDACHTFLNEKRTGLPVCNSRREVVGFVSEKDCLKVLFDSAYEEKPLGFVKDIMKKDVKTISFSSSLSYIIEMFTKNPFHIYPMVDDNGFYIGLVKRGDILKFLMDLHR